MVDDVLVDVTTITDNTVSATESTETTLTAAELAEVQPAVTSVPAEVDVSDNITVYSGVIPADVVSVARDLIAGSSDDYFFSNLDHDSYFLIIAKGGIDGESLQADDCCVYQLDYITTASGSGVVGLARTDFDSVQINNALGYLSYSSLDGYPHLMEGGSYYEFATLLLLLVFAASWLLDRVFSHIGNKG